MKLRTNVTLLFHSAVNNIIFVCFMSQVWAMKLAESTNICYVSDRVPFAIKMNVKETFMENDSFCICLCGEGTVVGV